LNDRRFRIPQVDLRRGDPETFFLDGTYEECNSENVKFVEEQERDGQFNVLPRTG
jgi:hypothetical protein